MYLSLEHRVAGCNLTARTRLFRGMTWQDPSLDVYPDWWGPLVTAVEHVGEVELYRDAAVESLCPGDDARSEPPVVGTPDGNNGGGDRRQKKERIKGISLAASVLHVPENGRVCAYVGGSLLASLAAHGSGEALVQVPHEAVFRDEPTAVLCVAGDGGCARHPHLDPECLLSASSLSLANLEDVRATHG